MHFAVEPYSADLSQSNLKFDLLTGKVVVETWGTEDMQILLSLGGVNATLVEVSSPQLRKVQLKSLYVDRLGNQDKGLQRGELIYFSQTAMDQIVEILLSGEWVDYYKDPYEDS
jgi:hypothetical protein